MKRKSLWAFLVGVIVVMVLFTSCTATQERKADIEKQGTSQGGQAQEEDDSYGWRSEDMAISRSSGIEQPDGSVVFVWDVIPTQNN